MFEYKKLPGGGIRMQAPDGEHDDCVIALCLSLQGLAGTAEWWRDKKLMTYLAGSRDPSLLLPGN